MATSENDQQLHILFFPFLAHGHMIPMLDMAKLFSSNGAKTTLITTPHNFNLISNSLSSNPKIQTLIIEFPPPEQSGLPKNCENLDQIDSPELTPKFFFASACLQQPLERLLEHHRPDCLISDMFFPWSTESAARFHVPRIVFHGTCFFSLCCSAMVMVHKPHLNLAMEDDTFIIPEIPDKIELMVKQLPDFIRQETETEFTKLLRSCKESELQSYGVVVNSFYELEPRYGDHYREVMGRKAWSIGPVSLCNRGNGDKSNRGMTASIDEHECLKWLNPKNPKSVIYVCFGSLSSFSTSQLIEIAIALERSGYGFIWVVRKQENTDKKDEKWLPEGFEKRMEGRGLIIRGWAPQVLILDHESIGGFVTHCGWNSTLEGICAGVPMVTWPIFAEQFYNEKLVVQILRVGVAVGAKEWIRSVGGSVGREKIEKAVVRVMEGEEGEEMRRRALELRGLAKEAIQEGGSSWCGLHDLMEELRLYGKKKTSNV